MADFEKQILTKFKPTHEQLVFADAYIKHTGNISKACEEMDEGRHTYYQKWRKQDGFEEWLSEYVKKEILKRTGKWYLIAEKYAETGSFKHLEMLMQIAKELAPRTFSDQSVKQYAQIYLPEPYSREEINKRIVSITTKDRKEETNNPPLKI